jgi:phospholipase C
MSNKRYYLFSGCNYYPNGGASDYDGEFDTIKEATEHYTDLQKLDTFGIQWGQVFDNQTKMVVKDLGEYDSP